MFGYCADAPSSSTEPPALSATSSPNHPTRPDQKVVIVGAGFGGIGAAIELQRHGFNDITILEAGPELGGTWFYNDYPGSACDIPSQLYSYSFEQRRDWVRHCTPQPKILRYLKDVAAKYGIAERIVNDTKVTACTWSDETSSWTLETETGQGYTADAIILATGQLNQPAWPSIPGVDTFQGESFHSARWDHRYDLHDKRVAVIGTGASAAQFVPVIADHVAKLTVFQRSGNWFMPRKNRPYPKPLRAAIAHLPGFQAYRRSFIYHYAENLTRSIKHPATMGRLVGTISTIFMRWQLRGNPEVRRKAWPDYTFGCKRVLFSSYYLRSLTRPNVELVTNAITEITPTGVKTADGTVHEVDCLIYGTGFKTNDFMFPMEIHGAGGTSLRDVWNGGAHAHLGMTVPGFPSMFVLYGPNTNTSGGSVIVFLEAQAAYVRQALELVRAQHARSIEVRPDVESASDRALQEAFEGSAWLECSSWYRTKSGRIVANWPGYMREYTARTRVLEPTEFTLNFDPRPTTTAAAEQQV